VSLTWTIDTIKTKLRKLFNLGPKRSSTFLDFKLTLLGNPVDEKKTLLEALPKDKRFTTAESVELVGSREVIVKDKHNCVRQIHLGVEDTELMSTVMERYVAKVGRTLHRNGCVLRYKGREILTEKGQHQTLYDVISQNEKPSYDVPNADEGIVFDYAHETEPYKLKVKKKNEIQVLSVYDHFRVAHVKALFSEVGSALGVNDRLKFDMTLLDDDDYLVKHSLRHGSLIEVEIDDTKNATTTYTCGNCGNDVVLSRHKQVKCKYCDYRVVYKKRSMFSLEYDCV
jgi:DNA-directed RNA polymerase subunit RPC12/RpoP